MIKANNDNPDIKCAIKVKRCPPEADDIAAGMAEAGIPVDPAVFKSVHMNTAMVKERYAGKPEFSEDFFR